MCLAYLFTKQRAHINIMYRKKDEKRIEEHEPFCSILYCDSKPHKKPYYLFDLEIMLIPHRVFCFATQCSYLYSAVLLVVSNTKKNRTPHNIEKEVDAWKKERNFARRYETRTCVYRLISFGKTNVKIYRTQTWARNKYSLK